MFTSESKKTPNDDCFILNTYNKYIQYIWRKHLEYVLEETGEW